jgi:hypothetical protein
MKWVEGIPIMFFLQILKVTERQWKRVMEKTAPFDSAEPFGFESFDLVAFRPRATRHELVDMSQGRGALDRL